MRDEMENSSASSAGEMPLTTARAMSRRVDGRARAKVKGSLLMSGIILLVSAT
ncbi:Uncharacterised protein [Mycobacteroides abscessus]|uniref:Uncharacterized protein n=3 Tax=Mycobacteroides abscessus TaxID=36809 RepID=A0AB74FIS9_9MYCO|nr:Uncharacterised protein [Mycobacteroides abscessus]SHP44836.1 Uncharacterised protein [Mycobacteroides abscessus subsp. abscessus]SKD20560.1 Uncharacterised protein [Mycobacteroides abscessus subsp. massiliense]CPS22163.1 Uncharacterised protein [Mycobacteroides abscessus]CPS65653.1 Uncharacterised protein [Mycobacteroides abscessus]